MKTTHFLSTLSFILLFLGIAQAQTTSCGCDSLYNGELVEIFESNCLYFDDLNASTTIPEGARRYCYGSRKNQWFDFYQATRPDSQFVASNNPRPIYIWAHGNSGSADIVSAKRIWTDELNTKRIHFLSWESVRKITLDNLDSLIFTAMDLNKIVNGIYDSSIPASGSGSPFVANIDTNQIFVGGTSRGSLVSWNYTQVQGKKIKGAYFAQALPNLIWVGSKPTDWININSPTMVLNYAQQYHSTNFHDAVNGKLIFDAYEEYNLDNCVIRHSIGEQGNLYDRLVYFINGGSIPAEREIDENNMDTLKYDFKDAECNMTYYDEPFDPDTIKCFELLYNSSSESPESLDLTFNNIDNTVTLTWEEGTWIDPRTNLPPTFDAVNDHGDYSVVRVFRTGSSNPMNLTFEDTPRLPWRGLLDSDNLGLTDWSIPSNYLNQSEDVHLAFQAKFVVDGLETNWSDAVILTIESTAKSGLLNQPLTRGKNEGNLKLVYNGVELGMLTSQGGEYQLSVFNLLGQEVQSINMILQEGRNTSTALSELSSGIYIVNLSGAQSGITSKLFIP